VILMLEQNGQILTLTFPTVDSATTFAAFLATLLQSTNSPAPAISSPPSGQLPDPAQPPIQDSLEPRRSRHTVLTEERMDQIANQRAQGLTTHQRLLRAQSTLRDGVLPFSKPGQVPQSTGQPSPRMRAQTEGTFADGLPQAAALRLAVPAGADAAVPPDQERKRSQLRPAASKGLPQ